VIVVGAGALGCACAAVFARKDWSVTIVDGGGAQSASAVAAGMLAPAMEAVLDGADAARAALLLTARDQWPSLALASGIELVQDGALWLGADPEGVDARFRAFGFRTELRGGGAFTPEDWRLDARAALAGLVHGVRVVSGEALSADATRGETSVRLDSGELLAADHVVLATGVGSIAASAASAALDAVTPVRGQLVLLAGEAPPCVVRTEGAYLAPRPGGLLVGATMEAGRRDLQIDATATAALIEAAARAWPAVLDATVVGARVGVRGASPTVCLWRGLWRRGCRWR
jgi:glycine oxidase